MSLELIFWICLIGGVLFTLLVVLIGNFLEGLFEGVLDFGIFKPITIVGAITAFGGAGLILPQLAQLSQTTLLIASVSSGVASLLLLYLFYVRPMKKAENSTGFRMSDLVGKKGEVTVTIPAHGYGEVMLLVTGGNTNQIAQSANQQEIPQGTTVIVVEVKESILIVSPQ